MVSIKGMAERINIPFNRATFLGDEKAYLVSALARGHISGNGAFTKKCQDLLRTEIGVLKVLLTTSCTHALEMAGLLLDINAGDEVIVPSFTFVSTVNAFVLRGAKPVFIDIRPDTLNLDESQLPDKIMPSTKAILPVHYAGVGCEMDLILEIANSHGIGVIEDNAHGLFGKYKGQYLGTFGGLATQSFHETKNFTCGEGGALLINNPDYMERSEIISEKGTNRSRFYRGEVDKYTWVDVGSSYFPADILAAFLLAQLERREQIQRKRKQIWDFYYEKLDGWIQEFGVNLPVVPKHCEQTYHIFYLLLPDQSRRRALIDHLKSNGILSVFHYQPLHLSEMGRKFGGKPGDCPVTEYVSDRLLRLPLFYSLTEEEQDCIVAHIRYFLEKSDRDAKLT